MTQETQPAAAPEITVLENREGELVFSASIDAFIDIYNGFYRDDYGRDYLAPSSEWQSYSQERAVHPDHKTTCYYFTEDESAISLPTITAYVPANGDAIQEITVNFDEHSYTEVTYELYEQMCYYTLKVFLPKLSDEEIVDLYTQANRLGNENVFSSEEWYDSGAVPCTLFYRDGIGIYPYFAIGDWMRLCVIPVTEETVESFRQKGVEIYEIQ